MGFRLLAFAAVLACAGCSLLSQDPYSELEIGDVDRPEEETQAAIVVGDPQVIMRETLINDRLRETAFLDVLIERSESEDFGPQILRDLAVVETMAVQLGISFNPAAGRAFERSEEIASLQTEIELLKLRNELEELRELSETDPTATDLNTENDAPSVPDGLNEPPANTTANEIAEALKAVRELLEKLGQRQARESQSTASPEERFEDLNAYRALLRQRQTEVKLDDVHDARGNALYRLQFTASVFPAEDMHGYGVLDIEVRPPTVKQDDLETLYDNWLISLMIRDFEEKRQPTNTLEWSRNQSRLLQDDLFERVILFDDDGLEEYVLFVYPSDDETIIDMITGVRFETIIEDSEFTDLNPLFSSSFDIISCNYLYSNNIALNYLEALEIVRSRRSLSPVETFLDSRRNDLWYQLSLFQEESGSSGFEQQVTALTEEIEFIDARLGFLQNLVIAANDTVEYVESHSDIDSIMKDNPNTNCVSRIAELRDVGVPQEFVGKVMDSEMRLGGQAYTYQAQPTRRVQRLSTVASAVNSMQAAFALAATLPGQGIGLNAGAAASRHAVGTIEAIERSPLVIGYTDRQSLIRGAATESARFGYLFGPTAVLSPSDQSLVYRQLPASHSVFADVSVPAWWPEAELEVRTVWAGDWKEAEGSATVVEGQNSGRTVPVRLRSMRDGLFALTAFLANQTVGDWSEATITDVFPTVVAPCERNVRFVIEGRDLWRNPTVFLRGQQHRNIEILPDMRGIAVTIDVDRLPKGVSLDEQDPGDEAETLVVWTTFGRAQTEGDIADIDFTGLKDGVPCPRPGDAEGARLRSESTRFVNNSELRIVAVTDLPPVARDVQVVGQVRRSSGHYLPDSSVDAVGPDNEIYSGTIKFTFDSNSITDSQVDGAEMRVGLSYKVIDGGAWTITWADLPIVYYPSEDASKFGIESETSIPSFETPVMMHVPAQIGAAYPEFEKTEGAFTATISAHGGIRLDVDAKWASEANGRIPITFSWARQDGSEADENFFRDWCSKPQTITLALPNPQGQDLPGFSNANVVLDQRTENCS